MYLEYFCGLPYLINLPSLHASLGLLLASISELGDKEYRFKLPSLNQCIFD